ncbi:MAG: CotH kinase family protein [Lachnospiraceae bacterium]|nr:CotH kinase family protein [Lachnospiraceae bacterium]
MTSADNTIPLKIRIETEDGAETIRAWYDKDTGINYFFLPAYSNSDNTIIAIEPGVEASVDKQSILDKSLLYEQFEFGKKYSLTLQNGKILKKTKQVQFEKAENVSTIFIETATGSMKEVLSDKSHKEPSIMHVYTSDGVFEKNNSDLTINGRGNSTWTEEKKPFTLKLDSPQSFLNMEESSRWILLANARDYSNLKNKMVFDLARKEGMPNTPENEYALLYVNGNCYGLYLFCQSINTLNERNEDSKDTLNLCKIEYGGRVESIVYKTDDGDRRLPVEVILPKSVGNEEEEIKEKIIQIDKCLRNPDISSNKLAEIIDIESWAKKYLIDEIFENYDGGIASSYFYWNGYDGIVYAGPVWDYDNCLGYMSREIKNPAALFNSFARRGAKQPRYWYSELYNNQLFFGNVVKEYRDRFSGDITELITQYIPNMRTRISKAIHIDEILWKYEADSFTDNILSYLSIRKHFLDDYWLNSGKYCVVRYYSEGDIAYRYEFVPFGKTILDSEFVDSTFTNSGNEYRIEETGEKFNIYTELYEDVNLVKYNPKKGLISEIKSLLSDKSNLLVIVTFCSVLLITLIIMLRERLEGAEKYEKRKR